MELLNKEEIDLIAKRCGYNTVIRWSFEDLSNKMIGYLGDHLKLNIVVLSDEKQLHLELFVKCMPRFEKWKFDYIKESNLFKKEFIMLSEVFKQFPDKTGNRKWRPKLYFTREDLFVFEDVTSHGYSMPHYQVPMNFEDIITTVKTIARFHSESYVFEAKRSKELGRSYRIWEEYEDFLQESHILDWRHTGRNAVIDFLKEYSVYKNKPNFNKNIETVVPMLFDGALTLLKPNFARRNVIIQRDLWTNNIFLKSNHALIIDFQTVLYSSPMHDLSSFVYFNTTKLFRKKYTKDILKTYYETMSEELSYANLDISNFFDIATLNNLYEESIMFGITQAALILPIVAMSSEKRGEIFGDPETSVKANFVTRSKEFIEVARENRL